jgi:TolB-like protein/Tfp pilus assembly protein PilF
MVGDGGICGGCQGLEAAAEALLRRGTQMSDARTPYFYEFASFRMDVRRRLLLRVTDGRPVPLVPRAFDTLLLLVEHAGQTVEKALLMEKIWPNAVVEENNLTQHVSSVRKALGERLGDHRFIVTVPGRGYRFVANVVRVADRPAGTVHPVLLPVATPTIARTGGCADASIAVLPFANLTGDPSLEYVGDGVAEELIHALTRIPALKVPARTSSFAYKGRSLDVRQIARELGVARVLEGSVRSAGERVRITAQLVDAETGYQVWSRSLERKLEDLLALQDDLAAQIAGALQSGLAPAATARTCGLDSYLPYLQALALIVRPAEQNLCGAIDLLQQAIRHDPGFARAHAELARAYAVCVVFGFGVPNAMLAAEQAAEQALLLDPELAEVHALLGQLNCIRGNWLEAAARYRVAISLSADPRFKAQRFIYLSSSVGHVRAALDDCRQAFQDAPRDPMATTSLCVAHVLMDSNEEGRHFADLAVSLGQPRTLTPLVDMNVQLAWRAGHHDEAARLLASALPNQTVQGLEAVRLLCGELRGTASRGAAVTALRGLEDSLSPEAPDPTTRKRLLLWYTMLGALDTAHDLADRLLDHYAESGTVGAPWGVLWMNEMASFRSHRRFRSFAARLGLLPYWQHYGPPDGHEWRSGAIAPQ